MTRFITCRDDQTVADASYRQRINIPLDCRDGACGTCKALCESGSYDGGDYIDDALSPDEAKAGYVLPCSMKPRSDLVLQIASTSDVAKTQAATYTGTVRHLDRLSATTVALGVEIPNRSELAFLPGQYVNIAVPGTDQTRSYSFSNAPDDDLLTFLVKLTPGGVMSDYLSQRAAVGDTISFTGPNGSFFLREADRPVLLLAGGTGLAPVLSMLRTMRAARAAARRTSSTASAPTRTWWLSTRSRRSPRRSPDSPGTTASRTRQSTAEHKGYVTSLIAPKHLYDGDVAVYLCGPPPMVESVRTHVDEGRHRADRLLLREVRAGPCQAPRRSRPPRRPRQPRRNRHCCCREDARGIAGQRAVAADGHRCARRHRFGSRRRTGHPVHRRPGHDPLGGSSDTRPRSTPMTAR